MTPATWSLLGGFCEDYVGYGGEDTDLGRVSRERGVCLVWVDGADAYHQQHHPVSLPLVEHLDAIVRNANLFHARWGDAASRCGRAIDIIRVKTLEHHGLSLRGAGTTRAGHDGRTTMTENDENDTESGRKVPLLRDPPPPPGWEDPLAGSSAVDEVAAEGDDAPQP